MSYTAEKNNKGYLGSTKKKSSNTSKKGNKKQETLSTLPLFTNIDNFYLTDFICENSAIMAKVSKTSRANKKLKRTSIYN